MSNKATGRAGRDAEVIVTRTGRPMAKFSLAKQGGVGVLWVDVVGFDEVAAAMMQSVRKGDLVTVEGEETDNTYTNRVGEKITQRQILAQAVSVGAAVPPTGNPYHKPAALPSAEDDDIPF